MPERCRVRIGHGKGLHARPAALVAQTAGRFQADTRLLKGEQAANAKNILEVMILAVGPGEEVTIEAEGADAKRAVAALAKALRGTSHE